MPEQAVSFLFPATVREHVLEQHQTLRQLLDRALVATTDALGGTEPEREGYRPSGP
jgi:hypothetical protein